MKLEVEDDALKPANGKQSVDRQLESGIKLYTGINFSNVLAAVLPSVLEANDFYLSPNAGPSTLRRRECNQNYSWSRSRTDAFHEAAGIAANDLGYKKVLRWAPNYQAGRDALEGFKRTYKGEVTAEIYTKLETDRFFGGTRACALADADAIYQFHPGGAGINFAKQFANAGLTKTVPMLIPSFSMDARTVIATGDASEGVYALRVLVGRTRRSGIQGLRRGVQKSLWPHADTLRRAGL